MGQCGRRRGSREHRGWCDSSCHLQRRCCPLIVIGIRSVYEVVTYLHFVKGHLHDSPSSLLLELLSLAELSICMVVICSVCVNWAFVFSTCWIVESRAHALPR